MNRRSFFGTLLALVTAPFVAKVIPADDFGPHTALPASNGVALHPKAFEMAMETLGCVSPGTYVHHRSPAIDPFPFKPFCEFDAPIESMQTVTTNGNDTLLLVTSGGNAYLVDRHGVAVRL